MPDEITLDKEVFKALAGDTRISILKSLRQRRKTQSELAKEISIAAPTVKEHVDILARAGLVREIDDGHKWKYIELTVKGKSLLEPQDKRILVLLGTSLVGVVGAGVLVYSQLQRLMLSQAAAVAPAPAEMSQKTASAIADSAPSLAAGIAPVAQDAAQSAVFSLSNLPWFEFGFMLVCLLVFGISVGMWIKHTYS